MIKQLMEVERLPILNLQSNRQKLVAKDDAWRDIATRLSSLRTSLDALASASDLDRHITASPSNEQRAAAPVTGHALPQPASLPTDQPSTRHAIISTGGLASADPLAGARSLTIP